MKLCHICGVLKEYNLFSKNSARKDGLHYNCKPCDSKKTKKWTEKNKEKVRESKKNRRLSRIEEFKLKDKTRYEKNRILEIEKRKEYYKNNRKKVAELAKKIRERKSEEIKHYKKEWNSNNRSILNSLAAKRKSLKLNSTPNWLSAIELAQIQEMYDVSIARTAQTGVRHHVDHIHPLHGSGFNGLHVPWNLQILTMSENLSKGKKLPTEDAHLAWGA